MDTQDQRRQEHTSPAESPTICRLTGKPCPHAFALMGQLQAAMRLAGASAGGRFEMSGSVEIAHCGGSGPCLFSFLASPGESFLFGGVAQGADAGALRARFQAGALSPEQATLVVRTGAAPTGAGYQA